MTLAALRESLVSAALALGEVDSEDDAAYDYAVSRLCRAALRYGGPREPKGPIKRPCCDCGRVRFLTAHGRCDTCYRRRRYHIQRGMAELAAVSRPLITESERSAA